MKKNKKKIVNILIVGMIIGIVIWISIKEYEEMQIGKTKRMNVFQPQAENQVILQNEAQQTENIKENIVETYQGYKVCAKLEIPAISLETYILDQYSTQALNISVTKFWGANPNEIGNFCIAGHNFNNKNMFHNLKKLQIGDELLITDNKTGKIKYEIYDIDKVVPNDVSCLSQETNNREVTLITCTNDSQKRIIVKAKEI